MKMEYGYKYKYESVLETVFGYDKLFDEALFNQTFTYTNAWEDMKIYKNFIALVKADKTTINNQNPSSLVKGSKGLGESLPLISLNGGKDFGTSPIVIFRKLTNDFIFHSYNQVIKLFSEYSDKSTDSFILHPNINNLMKPIDENDKSFDHQKDMSILKTDEHRFDFLKNLYANEDLKSFKYINNLYINADSLFFNHISSYYTADTSGFFNKTDNYRELNELTPFSVPKDFVKLEDIKLYESIPTSIKWFDYIGVYKLPKEILDKLDLTWLSIPKNIPEREDILGLTKHFNISTFAIAPVIAPFKNINPSDILGMTVVIPDFITSDDCGFLYKALTKDTFYLDTYGFDKKTKDTTIASFVTFTKGDRNVFFTENQAFTKYNFNISIYESLDIDKAGSNVLFNETCIVSRYGDNITFSENNTLQHDDRDIVTLGTLNLQNSDKILFIPNDISPLYKALTKDLSIFNYERVYMTKDSKSMDYQNYEMSLYMHRIKEVSSTNTIMLGDELKFRPIYLLDTGCFAKKNNIFDVTVDAKLMTIINTPRNLSANSFVSMHRTGSYNSVVKVAQVELDASRKAVDTMYSKVIDLHREVPGVNIIKVIDLATRTNYLSLAADKIIFINKLSKGTATPEQLLTILKADKSVVLNMLGLWITKTSKDFKVDELRAFATKSNKNIGINGINMDVSKSNKLLGVQEQSINIGNVIKDISSESTAFNINRKSKSLGKPVENINISSAIVDINSKEFKIQEFSNTIHEIINANELLLKYLSTITDIRTIDDTFSNLSNMIDVEADKTGNKWVSPIKQFGADAEQSVGLTTLNLLATMPFIEELVNDPIGRDIVMFEMQEPATVDDEFIHFKTGGLDELLLPSEDFDYSVFKETIFDYTTGLPINPVKKINDTTFIAKYPVDHSLGFGGELGRKYVNVNVYNLKFLLEIFYVTWQKRIFEFGTMDLRTGVQKMMKYMAMYIEYRIPPNIQEESWRCYELMRWYAEATIMYNSTYQITFKYKSWESALYTGIISCPHTLTDVIINSGYVLENTANHAEIELQQEVKKEGFIQFDARIYDGRMDVYINTIKVTSITTGKRVILPIIKGTLDVKIVFDGESMRVGNIIIDNCEFDDIVTEYHMEVGKANLGLDLITKRICSFFEVTDANFDTMKEGIQGSLSLRDLSNRLLEYFDDHHKNKTKGKRLTIKKGML